MQAGAPPLVHVNFDPELVKLLREVHDFLLLPSLPAPIPEAALSIFERDEAFRAHVASLELVASSFNNVNASVLPVERPLVAGMLAAAESALRKGVQVKDKRQKCGLEVGLQHWDCEAASTYRPLPNAQITLFLCCHPHGRTSPGLA